MTKAERLNSLIHKLHYSVIPAFFTVDYHTWVSNREGVIERVNSSFGKGQLIIIRSSAINETQDNGQNSGRYKSIGKIPVADSDQICNAINAVFGSYNLSETHLVNSEVIIQQYLADSAISGVAIYGDNKYNTHQYIIEYTTNNDTTTVTGILNRNVAVIADNNYEYYPPIYKGIVNCIREIRSILANHNLIIEFAEAGGTLYLFQVVATSKTHVDLSVNYLKQLQRKYSDLADTGSLLFSNMSDWNPAEIIGAAAHPFSISLYKELITDEIWAKARIELDYNVEGVNQDLMVVFHNRPYINVIVSLLSLLPNRIPSKLLRRVIAYECEKLTTSPYLHDKIEYEISLPIFPSIEISEHLHKGGFEKSEIDLLFHAQKKHTRGLLTNWKKIITDSSASCDNLVEHYKRCNRIHYKNFTSFNSELTATINDCKLLGTLPFAKVARLAFVGDKILKEIVSKKLISSETYDKFFLNVNTIAKQLSRDIDSYSLTNRKFLYEKYGHLRLGIYDNRASTYEDLGDLVFVNGSAYDIPEIEFEGKERAYGYLDEYFNISGIDYFLLFKESLEAREWLKFKFSKIVNILIKSFQGMAATFGIPNSDLSYLDIQEFISSDSIKISEIISKNKLLIEEHKIFLPDFISSPTDFDWFKYSEVRPNFITDKTVKGRIVRLSELAYQSHLIPDAILLIETIDPGYDFLLINKPKGIITKYGGMGSHISVRCKEFNLPAVIGCGELLFGRLQSAQYVEIECSSEKIIIL